MGTPEERIAIIEAIQERIEIELSEHSIAIREHTVALAQLVIVKSIVYSFAGAILLAVLTAIVMSVVKH